MIFLLKSSQMYEKQIYEDFFAQLSINCDKNRSKSQLKYHSPCPSPSTTMKINSTQLANGGRLFMFKSSQSKCLKRSRVKLCVVQPSSVPGGNAQGYKISFAQENNVLKE